MRCDGDWEEWRGMDRYWACTKCKIQSGGDFLSKPHWKDGQRPPDLLANPWRLVEALWKRGIWAQPSANLDDLDLIRGDDRLAWAEIIDGDLARALLQAAYNMLKEENHGR